jgi:hypothetical protein
MEWLKARRKLIVGILMFVTVIYWYSSKTADPWQTFLVLAMVSAVVIGLQVALMRILNNRR